MRILLSVLAWMLLSFPVLAAPPVIGSFTTSRSSVVSGQTATLNWSVTGATAITIDHGVGDVTAAGNAIAVSPTATTRYLLTASNAQGSSTAVVQVNYLALVQISPQLYKTEHVLFIIPDPAQVTFPDWNSVYSSTNVSAYVSQLKSVFPADYMMVVVAANNLTPTFTPNVLTYRHLADGIGQNSITGVGVPNICRYHIGTSANVLEPAFSVFDHEIGHNWGVQIGIEVGSGHWYDNTSVSGQMGGSYSDDGFLTVKQIHGDNVNGFTWTAIDNLVRNDSETFADQDLYAMGLQAVFPDTYVFTNPVYNADHTLSYGGVAKYDHAWAIGKQGPRIPGYQASDKQSRLGVVYIARDAAEIQNSYQAVEGSMTHFENAELIDTVKHRFQVPYLVETKFRGSVNARLEDLDGNANPTLSISGPTYLISTDGTASIPFQASDPDGPAPVVSLVPASANASVVNGNVVLQGLAPGTWFYTLKAEDAFGKKAFAHFVVDVVVPTFTFAAQSGVTPNSVVTSNAVVITGITAAAPISVAGGMYSLNGGPFTSMSGLVQPGDSVILRATSASGNGVTTSATVLVGYRSGAFTITTAIAAGAPALLSVVSRKYHASPVPFDLPITMGIGVNGAVSVEPRMIVDGHVLVFHFDKPITSVSSYASVDASLANVGSISVNPVGNNLLVTLTAVPDNQRVQVTLNDLNSSGLNVSVALGFLVGDFNDSRAVNASDISAVKVRGGQVTDATNFRFDVNASGMIDAADVVAVKARSGWMLP